MPRCWVVTSKEVPALPICQSRDTLPRIKSDARFETRGWYCVISEDDRCHGYKTINSCVMISESPTDGNYGNRDLTVILLYAQWCAIMSRTSGCSLRELTLCNREFGRNYAGVVESYACLNHSHASGT